MQISDSRWRFSLAVLLPVVTAVVLTLGLAAGFVLWSADRIDDRALVRQQALAARMIENAKTDFQTTQTDMALRYDVVYALVGDAKPDLDAVDGYLGTDEYDTYGHDRVYVLDADMHPIYAARAGAKADVRTYAGDQSVIDPLAVRLRAPEVQAAIAKYEDNEADYPPQVTDFVTLGGRVAIVGVLPIVTDWSDLKQQPGRYYYHVAVQFVGSDLAEYMMSAYMLESAHFDTVPNTLHDETMVPIANEAGRFVAYFKWKPDFPGKALLNETLPASLGLIAVVCIVIGALLFGLARSTKALEKARADAHHRATHDPLTGLANRALFTERLMKSPLPLTLLALDLDRFKAVNDTLGHEAGDDLLKQVGERLISLIRDDDLVARIGGDEFMILVSGHLETARGEELARQIVGSLAEPFLLGHEIARIGVSVGIASAITDERTELVSRADFALYDAKESGRNTFRVFDELQKAA